MNDGKTVSEDGKVAGLQRRIEELLKQLDEAYDRGVSDGIDLAAAKIKGLASTIKAVKGAGKAGAERRKAYEAIFGGKKYLYRENSKTV